MANAATIAKRRPVRMLLTGYPGAGKTGALASLANMGYKIRYLDFDGNTEPLLQYTKPEFLKNIDIVSLEDKLRVGAKTIETTGIPTAFADGLKMLTHWKYKEEDGTEVDLGMSKDWGTDTIVVLDSLTSMGIAAQRRVMSMMNKTVMNNTQQAWYIAQGEQESFIEMLTSERNRHHVIVLAHLKMVAPKAPQSGDDDLTKELKERAAEIIPTRIFPSALGQQLPQVIGGHFPTLLLVENKFSAGKAMRIIRTQPRPEMDIKLPSIQNFDGVGIEDGLAKIFAAIAPPLELDGPQDSK